MNYSGMLNKLKSGKQKQIMNIYQISCYKHFNLGTISVFMWEVPERARSRRTFSVVNGV